MEEPPNGNKPSFLHQGTWCIWMFLPQVRSSRSPMVAYGSPSPSSGLEILLSLLQARLQPTQQSLHHLQLLVLVSTALPFTAQCGFQFLDLHCLLFIWFCDTLTNAVLARHGEK